MFSVWQLITSDIASLRHNVADMLAKIDQYKRTQLLLSHRVLKVHTHLALISFVNK